MALKPKSQHRSKRGGNTETGGTQLTRSTLADLDLIKLGAANGATISLLGPFFQTDIMKHMITGLNDCNKLLLTAAVVLWWTRVMLLGGTLKVIFGDNQ